MSQEDKIQLRKLLLENKWCEREYGRKELRAFGLVVIKTRRHYQIMRTDGIGGIVTTAATPSDYRAAMNTFARVVRLIELHR